MYTLKIEATTFSDLKNQLQEKLKELSGTVVSLAQVSEISRAATPATPTPETAAATSVAPTAPAAAPGSTDTDTTGGKRGPGRPKKSKAEAEASPSTQHAESASALDPLAPVAASPAVQNGPAADSKPAVVVTKEQVMSALQSLTSNGGGIPAAQKALALVGAARLSEIKPEDFGKFIQGCEKLQAEFVQAKALQS